MDRERHGGWVTIMADQIAARSIRASLAQTCLARIVQHRQGTGPDLCARYRLHRLVWAERGATIEAVHRARKAAQALEARMAGRKPKVAKAPCASYSYRMKIAKSTLLAMLILLLGACGRSGVSAVPMATASQEESTQADTRQHVHNAFPSAKQVRLYVENDWDLKSQKPMFTKVSGTILNENQRQSLESALYVTKEPEMTAGCFVPHHYFRYYDGSGKQIGEIAVCFCCAGISVEGQSNIQIKQRQVLAIDYDRVKALVHDLKEPTDVEC